MDINYLAVLVCGILSLVIGSIWYGPLFGKLWLNATGMTAPRPEEMAASQKKMIPTYIAQLIASLVQVGVLAYFLQLVTNLSAVCVALWIWVGFTLPVIAGLCLWNNSSKKAAWTQFILYGGFQLVYLVVSAVILSAWK